MPGVPVVNNEWGTGVVTHPRGPIWVTRTPIDVTTLEGDGVGLEGWGRAETVYHREDALLYIAYVILIWAAPIPADRRHCSLWP